MADAPKIRVGDVMTKDVLAIDANDTLDVIAGLFEKYDYDGMPVVDQQHTLLGMITAYDMVVQSSDVHIPTLIKLMEQIGREKGDRRMLDAYFGKLKDIKATSIMNPKVVSVRQDATLEEAAKIFADFHKVNPLCVVDDQGKLVGVLSRYDVIKFFNENYLQRVVQQVNPGTDPFKEFPTKSGTEVEEAVQKVEQEFLLVSRRRPLIWKYVAFAMFAAGLIAATALIIRIVQKSG
ncbi:MAG: CBS domain-containing protein [Candidatus Yanofskybacteria bacterium]|nr:CBS domain-containing protein [Candidatus Yanofskybacteria bacterium]